MIRLEQLDISSLEKLFKEVFVSPDQLEEQMKDVDLSYNDKLKQMIIDIINERLNLQFILGFNELIELLNEEILKIDNEEDRKKLIELRDKIIELVEYMEDAEGNLSLEELRNILDELKEELNEYNDILPDNILLIINQIFDKIDENLNNDILNEFNRFEDKINEKFLEIEEKLEKLQIDEFKGSLLKYTFEHNSDEPYPFIRTFKYGQGWGMSSYGNKGYGGTPVYEFKTKIVYENKKEATVILPNTYNELRILEVTKAKDSWILHFDEDNDMNILIYLKDSNSETPPEEKPPIQTNSIILKEIDTGNIIEDFVFIDLDGNIIEGVDF